MDGGEEVAPDLVVVGGDGAVVLALLGAKLNALGYPQPLSP